MPAALQSPPLEDGIRTIDGKQRITRLTAAARLELGQKALAHWETMYRQGKLSDPERLYPDLDCKVTRNPDPALTYPGNREVTYDLAAWLKLEAKIKADPPEHICGPDDEDYTHEDFVAKRLGYEALTLRRMYQNIGGGKPRKPTNPQKNRHGGSHHLGRQKIKTIDGPWYCHSGPPTKYLRTKDIDAIENSRRVAKNGWTDEEGKPRTPGEYIVDSVACVDRKQAEKLGLGPDALDGCGRGRRQGPRPRGAKHKSKSGAVGAGRIQRKTTISRKVGRKTAVFPKDQVLAEIERRKVKFNGIYPDGRMNIKKAAADFDFDRAKLADWVDRGIIKSVKQPPPAERGRAHDEHTVLPDDMMKLKALLAQIATRDGKWRPAPKVSTHAEICEALGVEKEADRILIGILLAAGRDAGEIPAQRPEVPLNLRGKAQRMWFYDTAKAEAYLSAAASPPDHAAIASEVALSPLPSFVPTALQQAFRLVENQKAKPSQNGHAANGHGTAEAVQTKQSTKNRRGRRLGQVATDVKQDAKIFDAWKSGHYRNADQLGNELKLSGDQVREAIDRHRKRLRKN